MSDPRQVAPPHATDPPASDPLRLCVHATVALLAWLLGPVAVAVFAFVGAAGYVQARRGGLLRSRCKLGDTRLVIVWLVALGVAGLAGTVLALTGHHIGL